MNTGMAISSIGRGRAGLGRADCCTGQARALDLRTYLRPARQNETSGGRSFRNANPPTVMGRPISLGGSEVHRMVDIVPGQPDRRIELVG